MIWQELGHVQDFSVNGDPDVVLCRVLGDLLERVFLELLRLGRLFAGTWTRWTGALFGFLRVRSRSLVVQRLLSALRWRGSRLVPREGEGDRLLVGVDANARLQSSNVPSDLAKALLSGGGTGRLLEILCGILAGNATEDDATAVSSQSHPCSSVCRLAAKRSLRDGWRREHHPQARRKPRDL